MQEYFKIVQCFFSDVTKENTEISIVESGLINNTFRLKVHNQTYIVQRINRNVFRNPRIIHENYSKVYEHLLESKYPLHKLDFIKSFNGDELVIHENEAWRISRYIEGEAHHICNSLEMAFNAAKALAEFHYCTKDMDVKKIEEPIQGFCDFSYRLMEFKESLISGDANRRSKANELIESLNANLNYIIDYIKLEKQLAIRIIHGDPKVSNFLFEKHNAQVISLIDIDTIMPGTILYDFGDLVRSFSNKTIEDSKTDNNCFEPRVYESLMSGYLSVGKQFMSKEEEEGFGLAVMTVSLIQSLRFLTDYLNLDIYYKVAETDQNLNRAINQFSFFKEIKEYLSL